MVYSLRKDSDGACSAAAFFRTPGYASYRWRHPGSPAAVTRVVKKGATAGWSAASWTAHSSLVRVVETRSVSQTLAVQNLLYYGPVGSEHQPLRIKLRIARNLSEPHESKASFVTESAGACCEILSSREISVQQF